ncbi:MAG: hypothetical protein JKY00_01245 [Roseicyclus sp.]|nr:hypothetical protein [Roseicyclus sp.]
MRVGGGSGDNGFQLDALYTCAPQVQPDVSLFSLEAGNPLPQMQEQTVGASFLVVSNSGTDRQVYGFGASYQHATGFGLWATAKQLG